MTRLAEAMPAILCVIGSALFLIANAIIAIRIMGRG